MTSTDIRTTDQLHDGLIVHSYGMRLRVENFRVVREGGEWFGKTMPTVYGADCVILNVDAVNESGAIPFGWRCEGDVQDGSHWYLQGNHLAEWFVEA